MFVLQSLTKSLGSDYRSSSESPSLSFNGRFRSKSLRLVPSWFGLLVVLLVDRQSSRAFSYLETHRYVRSTRDTRSISASTLPSWMLRSDSTRWHHLPQKRSWRRSLTQRWYSPTDQTEDLQGLTRTRSTTPHHHHPGENSTSPTEKDLLTAAAAWDVNASGSFGNLLMQMQKKEEALLLQQQHHQRQQRATMSERRRLGLGARIISNRRGTSGGMINRSDSPIRGINRVLSLDPVKSDRPNQTDAIDDTFIEADMQRKQEEKDEEEAAVAAAAATVASKTKLSTPDWFRPWDDSSSASAPTTTTTSIIDPDTAKELDDAVTRLTAPQDSWTSGLVLQPLNELYVALTDAPSTTTSSVMTPASTPTTMSPAPRSTTIISDATTTIPGAAVTDQDMALRRMQEYYQDRIGRDIRLLALSIATCTETVAQWRLFCQEGGGLFPLLEIIREGAQYIQPKAVPASDAATNIDGTIDETFMGQTANGNFATLTAATLEEQEETLRAACSACRAIRDICAISPELAAVITDGILRANASWRGGLFRDFCTMMQYANDSVDAAASTGSRRMGLTSPRRRRRNKDSNIFLPNRRRRREARLRCKLYVSQLLLAMAVASDDAITVIRSTKGLKDVLVACSSYARKERTRRWLRYPGELFKWIWRSKKEKHVENLRRPFLEAATVANDLNGQLLRTANQCLAAIGYNRWTPKIPGQKGLRILCLDGGGSRGMTSVTALRCLMQEVADGMGADVADSFDIIAGTSTGGIISFLTGLRRESSTQAYERYNQLIKQIFVKSALSTPLMFFTTATYDESPFMNILSGILQDASMLDSRADPAIPLVFCVTSKMSSTPTHVALFRNYNYAGGELADPFTIQPEIARKETSLGLELEHEMIQRGTYDRSKVFTGSPGHRTSEASRYPGSFRVLQRYALRASTAAPTVFKPVMMGGEMYCDGGIVASNPTAIAIHEARTLFPDIPIEMVVSIGTGGFLEQKSAPRIGWDGIIGQIVNSATDGEQIHHILEDILGDSAVLGQKASAVSKTKYFRFNPVLGKPDEFPIDVTDPDKLELLRKIAREYMNEPEQLSKISEIENILRGGKPWSKRIKGAFT